MIRRPPTSTLFPSTPLFRSENRPPARTRGPQGLDPSRMGGDGRAAPRGQLAHHRRSEEHTSELQSQSNLVCRLLLEKKKSNGDVGLGEPDQCSSTSVHSGAR